ncbi:MAG: hypothetical protein JWR15_1562, partial [Prosthecobacter sp.]|nr:hypothetical protein [Prosthecobacter sp.]
MTMMVLAMVLLIEPSVNAQQSATQVIDLQPGWNLISIQVGGPITPAFFKGKLDNPITTTVDESQRLIEVWSYQPSGNPSLPGSWLTYQPQVAGFASDLTSIEPGKGYWVNVSQFTQSTLTGTRWDGAVALQTGWNLVGFPGLDLSVNEANDPSSVFGTSFSRINQVWTFDTSLQRFSGYDVTAIPVLKELNSIRPAHGYWVYALEPVVLTPLPYVALPGDADGAPLQSEELFSAADARWRGSNPAAYVNAMVRYAGTGDTDPAGDGNSTGHQTDSYDLNGNGILDTPFTQDTLLFEVGVNQKVITLGNNGGGLASWTLQNSITWLATNPSSAAGVVSTDLDTVSLSVDRTGLSPGRQSGQFTIYLGGQIKVITVLVDVPTAAGDWKGLATTQRVNGKSIPIGAVDMGLNFFMSSSATTETAFTGVLNADKSLLFPRDVFMNGVFYSGNNFSLTTNFQMDAGDRNAPPYDTFSHVAPNTSGGGTLNTTTARQDKDYNGDHKLDVENPFPFAIHRQVTLLGQRTNPNHLEGSYIESITGMLPQSQPIFIEGTFFLDRQTLTPTKKSIFNGTSTNAPITIGSTTGTLYREFTLNVTSPVTISGVTVNLNLTFPDPSKLIVSLIGPNSQTVNLAAHTTSLGTTYTVSDFNG